MTFGRIVGGAIGFLVFIAAVTVFGGSWYTVNEGTVGIITRNNAFTSTVAPGLGYKMPIIDSVVEMSTRSETVVYNAKVYSRDQQPIDLALSVTYNITADQVERVYRTYLTRDNLVERVLARRMNEQAEIVFGKYTAPEIPGKRAEISLAISTAIKNSVATEPVVIQTVQLENVDFSDDYEDSIKKRMIAEIEVQKAAQDADRAEQVARQTVTEAQAQADSKLAIAKSDALAIQLRGEAEANAINARGKALRENPAVVELVQAEKWDGKLPTQMIPGSAVPFLSLTQTAQ